MRPASPLSNTTDDPRSAILDAAERLIALHGLEAPLRDIANAAGNRNNSAVNYFFGSRAGLVEAVLERRMTQLEAVRMHMLADNEAAGKGNDLHALVDTMIRPIVDIARGGTGTHYGRFLEVVRTHPAVPRSANIEGQGAIRIIVARLDAELAHLPRARRFHRLESMATASFGLIADLERALEHGTAAPTATDDIVDMLVGLLTATPTT